MATANVLSIKNQGIVSYDGSAAFNGRTLTAASSKLTITNGDGVSANPTVDAVEANFTLNNIGGTLGVSKGGTGLTTVTSNSLIIGHGTSAMTALGAATNGQIPIGSTGNAPVLATITAGTGITVTNGAGSIQLDSVGNSANANAVVDETDDFCYAGSTSTGILSIGPWSFVVNGTTPATLTQNFGSNAASTHPGVLTLGTGNSTNNRITMYKSIAQIGSVTTDLTASIILGGGALTLQWFCKIPTLSTAGDRFTIRIGLGDTAHTAQANGCYFEYVDNVNSGKWQIITAKASVLTTNNTTTTVDTGWHSYKIVVNAAASSVAFYIDGTQVANSPISTNIPTAAVTPLVIINKSAGTNERTLAIDLYTLNQVLTTAR